MNYHFIGMRSAHSIAFCFSYKVSKCECLFVSSEATTAAFGYNHVRVLHLQYKVQLIIIKVSYECVPFVLVHAKKSRDPIKSAEGVVSSSSLERTRVLFKKFHFIRTEKG